jgi:hypothetical protein
MNVSVYHLSNSNNAKGLTRLSHLSIEHLFLLWVFLNSHVFVKNVLSLIEDDIVAIGNLLQTLGSPQHGGCNSL